MKKVSTKPASLKAISGSFNPFEFSSICVKGNPDFQLSVVKTDLAV